MRASKSGAGTVGRMVIVGGALLALVLAPVGTRAQAPAQGSAAAQQPPQGGQRAGKQPPGRGRQAGPNANPSAGQTPVNAMIVTGGCCHDYTGQSKVPDGHA